VETEMRKNKSKKILFVLIFLFFLFLTAVLHAAERGDVNTDGSVNIVDALLIAQ
jgi:hypothetical protein